VEGSAFSSHHCGYPSCAQQYPAFPIKQNVILTLRNEGEESSEYARQQYSFRVSCTAIGAAFSDLRFSFAPAPRKAVKPLFLKLVCKPLILNRKEFRQIGRVLRDKPVK
jgi:hypothetical protein